MCLIVNQNNLGSSKQRKKKKELILNRALPLAFLYANKRSTAGASFMVWWIWWLINSTVSLRASVPVSCVVYIYIYAAVVGGVLKRFLRGWGLCWRVMETRTPSLQCKPAAPWNEQRRSISWWASRSFFVVCSVISAAGCPSRVCWGVCTCCVCDGGSWPFPMGLGSAD